MIGIPWDEIFTFEEKEKLSNFIKEAVEQLEHPLLDLLSLQSPRELQHIRNLFLLEQPESGTYSLAEWT